MKRALYITLELMLAAAMVLSTVGCISDIVNPDPETKQYYTVGINPGPDDLQLAIVPAGQKPIDSDFHRFDHGGGTWEFYLYHRDYRMVVRKIITHEWIMDETHSPDSIRYNAHYNNLDFDSCLIFGQGWQP